MMKIEIIRTYEYEDTDFSGDALQVEMFVDGNSVLCGDYYHNHIEDRMEGFMVALEFLNIPFVVLSKNINKEDYE